MWRTSSGDRILNPQEQAVYRTGLALLVDQIETHLRGEGDFLSTGISAFDQLTPEQQLVVLSDVAQALSDVSIPPPELTAYNEASIQAVFNVTRSALEVEILANIDTTIRQRVWQAGHSASDPSQSLPGIHTTTLSRWLELLEVIQADIFWDADFEMGDLFLDAAPESVGHQHQLSGIDRDYFLATPDEPTPKELESARAILAWLLRNLSGQIEPPDSSPHF